MKPNIAFPEKPAVRTILDEIEDFKSYLNLNQKVINYNNFASCFILISEIDFLSPIICCLTKL